MSSLLNTIKSLAGSHCSKQKEDMRFTSPLPPPEGSDFKQWMHAMRMVSRLPGGMPEEFRRKLWLSLAERHLQVNGIYWPSVRAKCLSDFFQSDDEELGLQIVKDLHRTGSSLCSGPEGSQNQAVLKRVLLGYARWNKTVGYCQGFNMLGALILQVMDMSEEDSIKVMIFLIEGVLPSGYFCGTLGGLSVDMAVFRDLLSARLPRLSRHLQHLMGKAEDGGAYEPPLTNVFTMQWFLTLFCTCLPHLTVLRVWDLIFLDGNEILLKTALALWDGLSDRILAVNSADEFYSIMGVVSREMLEFGLMDANTLIKKIIDIGSFPELPSLRDKYTYNITPWSETVHTAAKKGLKLFYSDDEMEFDDESNRLALTATYGLTARTNMRRKSSLGTLSVDRERLALDITILKQQYAKLRARQRQAHIILTAACSRQSINCTSSSPSISMNHLLLGKSAIISARGRRIAPPKGSVPPNRAAAIYTSSSTGASDVSETLQWKDADVKKRVLTRKSSIKLKDIPKELLSSEKSESAIEQVISKDSDQYISDISSDISNTFADECDISANIPESKETPAKFRRKSESSSYSDDSDNGSSTSTSLCDESTRLSDFDSEPASLSDKLACIRNTSVKSQTEFVTLNPPQSHLDFLIISPTDVVKLNQCQAGIITAEVACTNEVLNIAKPPSSEITSAVVSCESDLVLDFSSISVYTEMNKDKQISCVTPPSYYEKLNEIDQLYNFNDLGLYNTKLSENEGRFSKLELTDFTEVSLLNASSKQEHVTTNNSEQSSFIDNEPTTTYDIDSLCVRRNSDRALKIIHENSIILHKILFCQNRKIPLSEQDNNANINQSIDYASDVELFMLGDSPLQTSGDDHFDKELTLTSKDMLYSTKKTVEYFDETKSVRELNQSCLPSTYETEKYKIENTPELCTISYFDPISKAVSLNPHVSYDIDSINSLNDVNNQSTNIDTSSVSTSDAPPSPIDYIHKSSNVLSDYSTALTEVSMCPQLDLDLTTTYKFQSISPIGDFNVTSPFGLSIKLSPSEYQENLEIIDQYTSTLLISNSQSNFSYVNENPTATTFAIDDVKELETVSSAYNLDTDEPKNEQCSKIITEDSFEIMSNEDKSFYKQFIKPKQDQESCIASKSYETLPENNFSPFSYKHLTTLTSFTSEEMKPTTCPTEIVEQLEISTTSFTTFNSKANPLEQPFCSVREDSILGHNSENHFKSGFELDDISCNQLN